MGTEYNEVTKNSDKKEIEVKNIIIDIFHNEFKNDDKYINLKKDLQTFLLWKVNKLLERNIWPCGSNISQLDR